MQSWLPLLGLLPLVLLPAIWCFVCLLLSFISGWSRLHELYPATATPSGTAFSGQSGKVGGVMYRNSLNAVISQEGLYLSVFALLGMGHKPLLIPWSAMHNAEPRTVLWSRSVRVQIGQPAITTIELSEELLQRAKVGT